MQFIQLCIHLDVNFFYFFYFFAICNDRLQDYFDPEGLDFKQLTLAGEDEIEDLTEN